MDREWRQFCMMLGAAGLLVVGVRVAVAGVSKETLPFILLPVPGYFLVATLPVLLRRIFGKRRRKLAPDGEFRSVPAREGLIRTLKGDIRTMPRGMWIIPAAPLLGLILFVWAGVGQ